MAGGDITKFNRLYSFDWFDDTGDYNSGKQLTSFDGQINYLEIAKNIEMVTKNNVVNKPARALSNLWVISELIVLLFNDKKRAFHDYIAGTVVVCKEPLKNKMINKKMSSRLKLFLFILLIIMFASFLFVFRLDDSYQQALRAYEKGDYQTAVLKYKQGALRGDALSQYNLACMYRYGQGVDRNDQEAVVWLRKAAEKGYEWAQVALGIMYYEGKGVDQSYQDAATWFFKAAAKGNTRAQSYIGIMYLGGQGFNQDYIEAQKWLLKAAKDDTLAMYSMGFLYARGEGVKRDKKIASNWFMKAALLGYADAQRVIAAMYRDGDGIERNMDEALKWYLKAVDQGDYKAMSSLGMMYHLGIGVNQDLPEAYKWYFIAYKYGDTNVSGLTDIVKRELNSLQIVEADQAVSNWILNHTNK